MGWGGGGGSERTTSIGPQMKQKDGVILSGRRIERISLLSAEIHNPPARVENLDVRVPPRLGSRPPSVSSFIKKREFFLLLTREVNRPPFRSIRLLGLLIVLASLC